MMRQFTFAWLLLLASLSWAQFIIRNSSGTGLLTIGQDGRVTVSSLATTTANDSAVVIVDANGKLLRFNPLGTSSDDLLFWPVTPTEVAQASVTADHQVAAQSLNAAGAVPAGATHALISVRGEVKAHTPYSAAFTAQAAIYAGAEVPGMDWNQFQITDNRVALISTTMTWRNDYDYNGTIHSLETVASLVPLAAAGTIAWSIDLLDSEANYEWVTAELVLLGYVVKVNSGLRLNP